jgi:hypothetical protein
MNADEFAKFVSLRLRIEFRVIDSIELFADGLLVDRARGYFVRELGHGRHGPAPGCRPVVITGKRELISSSGAFPEPLLAVAFEHQLRCAPNVDLGYHAGKAAQSSSIKLSAKISPQLVSRVSPGLQAR